MLNLTALIFLIVINYLMHNAIS